mmetsp:Transcript_60631/g.146525  ORF Transcript_60631/g.146525 Transcript_60631/m.146525 type:complete len:638 (-) Transcript_60631:410-2323(-)
MVPPGREQHVAASALAPRQCAHDAGVATRLGALGGPLQVEANATQYARRRLPDLDGVVGPTRRQQELRGGGKVELQAVHVPAVSVHLGGGREPRNVVRHAVAGKRRQCRVKLPQVDVEVVRARGHQVAFGVQRDGHDAARVSLEARRHVLIRQRAPRRHHLVARVQHGPRLVRVERVRLDDVIGATNEYVATPLRSGGPKRQADGRGLEVEGLRPLECGEVVQVDVVVIRAREQPLVAFAHDLRRMNRLSVADELLEEADTRGIRHVPDTEPAGHGRRREDRSHRVGLHRMHAVLFERHERGQQRVARTVVPQTDDGATASLDRVQARRAEDLCQDVGLRRLAFPLHRLHVKHRGDHILLRGKPPRLHLRVETRRDDVLAVPGEQDAPHVTAVLTLVAVRAVVKQTLLHAGGGVPHLHRVVARPRVQRSSVYRPRETSHIPTVPINVLLQCAHDAAVVLALCAELGRERGAVPQLDGRVSASCGQRGRVLVELHGEHGALVSLDSLEQAVRLAALVGVGLGGPDFDVGVLAAADKVEAAGSEAQYLYAVGVAALYAIALLAMDGLALGHVPDIDALGPCRHKCVGVTRVPHHHPDRLHVPVEHLGDAVPALHHTCNVDGVVARDECELLAVGRPCHR